MKKINFFKNFLFAALLISVNAVNAQFIHPLAFNTTYANFYASYVGVRLEVTAPIGSTILGDKIYSTPGGTTGGWGGVVTTPIVNDTVVLVGPDSFGCATIVPPPGLLHWVALIWRGPISSACEFGYKALQAQNAGAEAVVIINEYAGQGPVGMGPGASGASVTIPAFMIGNLDGIAICNQYHTTGFGSVKMTITPWGLNNKNDLGFVPAGPFGWHNYATPANQMRTGTNPFAFKGLDGGFIANYGTHDATNVKLHASLAYTPTGGSPTVIYADSSAALPMFHPIDSIYAYVGTEYNFAPTGTSGNGRFDLNYLITSDSADQYTGDNSYNYSFYTTDSTYSKGRYDFANNVPVSTIHESVAGGTDFLWGPMYYIANKGSSINAIQFSVEGSTAGAIPVSMSVYVLKWIDGSAGQPLDSVVEAGELNLVSLSSYGFTGPGDTSGGNMKLTTIGDATGTTATSPIMLDSNSWYYVAVEVSGGYFLGCDGVLSAFPRIYGRAHTSNIYDYSNWVFNSDYSSLGGTPGNVLLPSAFTGNGDVDSFNYAGQKGVIPSIALIVNNHPDTSHVVVPPGGSGVKATTKPTIAVSVYPNPASDYLDISTELSSMSKTVTYSIIDGLARFVTKEVHNNVQKEEFRMSTSTLAPGSYYLIINAGDKITSKKFTILR